jgi:predicted acylesterase/phospholipase RssA
LVVVVWKLSNIESIYATSIGSIIAVFLCLKFDWETLNKYIIERPWKDAFKVSVTQIWNVYNHKGLFDKHLCEIILKPLLKAKDLKLTITLKEFYEFCKIDLHFFAFDVNRFETVEINHILYPDMMLVQALTISSSLPGIFMPAILDDKCLIDGGVMCNYPINQCLRDHSIEEEILGIKIHYSDANNDNNDNNDNINDKIKNGNLFVKKDSSLLEYTICLTINAMNYIRDSVKLDNIKNTILVNVYTNPLSLESIKQIIESAELRKQFFDQGENDAIKYLSYITQIENDDKNINANTNDTNENKNINENDKKIL